MRRPPNHRLLRGARGALTNYAYGATARGLRWLTFGSNTVMGAFGVFAGTVDRAEVWQFTLVLGLFLSASALSCSGAARKTPGRSSEV
jgi:hypothetical protein